MPSSFPRLLLLLFVLAPVALPLSCSSKADTAPPANGFVARFELPKGSPDMLQVPFPSDLMRAADGTITIPGGDGKSGIDHLIPREKGAQFLVEALAKTRGFGVYGGAIFELDGQAPDPTKLPKGSPGDCTGKDAPIYLVDLDAGQAIECQAGWNDDNLFNPDMGTTPVLVVRTARGRVLPEGHKIAVLLTSGVVSTTGAALAETAQFGAIRDGARGDAPSKLYGDAIDAASAKIGFDKKRVVAAAVYTTGNVTEELRSARQIAGKTPVPTLKWGKDDLVPVTPSRFTATTPLPADWTATLDDLFGTPNKLGTGEDDPDWGDDNPGVPHDAIASMGVAVFDAPNFLLDLDAGYNDPAHATFFHGADGKVAINPAKTTAKIWVTFIVPKATMPTAGYPAVVFQHGMGGQRGDALTIANSFARKGWAVVSIEPVQQGTRGNDALARGDTKSDFARKTSKYAGPDGFIDKTTDGGNYGPLDLFGGLFRLAALRDQFRQSAVDHTTLLRLLQSSPSLDGLAQGSITPKIDGSKTAYIGDSLGGILGSLTAGIEPGHKAYVLNVPGGGLLVELATNSPNIYSLLNGSASLNFGYRSTQVPPHHPLVNLMQHVIDGGDPIAVAGTVLGDAKKGTNVLMIEVLADELVSNESTEALAFAMGLQAITPHGPLLTKLVETDGKGAHDVPKAGSTGVLVQQYTAQHGNNIFSKNGTREYAAKRPLFGVQGTEPFPKLATIMKFENPYLQSQAALIPFLADALDSKVPTVVWTKAPAEVKDP
jgi:hypothetical protein